MIEGTTMGVSTDVDGKYTLECPPTKDLVLVFFFVGMKLHREVVGNKTVNRCQNGGGCTADG